MLSFKQFLLTENDGSFLLNWEGTDANMKILKAWLSGFNLTGRAPKGKKKEFQRLQDLYRDVKLWDETKMISPNIGALASWLKPADIETYKGMRAKKKVTTEIKNGNLTFINESPLGESRFKTIAADVTKLLGRLKGFHKKALRSGLTVVIKPTSEFRAKAKYKTDKDEIWIGSSPKVTKLLGKELYGWVPYIIIHELGHRYERFVGHPTGYDRNRFITTPYSRQEHVMSGGEDFAELFALSFFGSKISSDFPRYADKVKAFKELF